MGGHASLCSLVYRLYLWELCLVSSFLLANLLIYHFGVRGLRSLHVWTFLLAQFLVVGQLMMFQSVKLGLAAFAWDSYFYRFNDFWFSSVRIVEDLKDAQVKQNAQINLLLAENERSRIGQDLHDSQGHTFAMLSVKTDLAFQFFLQNGGLSTSGKVKRHIHQD